MKSGGANGGKRETLSQAQLKARAWAQTVAQRKKRLKKEKPLSWDPTYGGKVEWFYSAMARKMSSEEFKRRYALAEERLTKLAKVKAMEALVEEYNRAGMSCTVEDLLRGVEHVRAKMLPDPPDYVRQRA